MSAAAPLVTRPLMAAFLAGGLLLALPAALWAQGSLFGVREGVRDEPRRTPPAHDDDEDDEDDDHDHRHRHGYGHGHHHHYDDCDDDDELETLAAKLIGYAITSPFWGPHVMVDQGFDVPGHFYGHPYDRGSDGVMLIGNYDRPANHLTRLDIEYAMDFDDLERAGGRVLWEHTSRLGVDSSFNFLREDLGAAGHDQLWLGDVNFVYRFAQCENFVMRTGLGVNWLADSRRGDAGFNFTYGADWFPADPLVVSTEIDWGTLGDAELFHGRATVGIVRDHVEIYTGFDYYDVDGVPLKGVIAGIRVWF